MEISVILPAYNEQENIEKSFLKANNYLLKKFKSFEIIVVNDGSKDRTGEILRKLKKSNKSLRVIEHKKNLGYGAAVWKGLKAARGDLVFFTDSDLQFDIKELGKFVKAIKNRGAVIGYRLNRSEGAKRAFNAWGWKIFCRILLGIRYKDIDCAFKLIRRSLIKKMNITSRGAAFSAELLYKISKQGGIIGELPVKHFKRTSGSATGSKLSVISRGFKEIYRFYRSQKELVRSRSMWAYAGAIILLFASRYFFASWSADFFDSSQYIWRSMNQNILQAMATGHPPFHPLYLFFSTVFNKIFHPASGIFGLTLTSVIFGSVSIIFLYLTVRELFSNKTAWLTAIIYALLPFVYFSQITILVDPVMQAFYFISLYLFTLSFRTKKHFLAFSFFSGLAMGLAAFAHTQVAFWLTGLLAVILLKIKGLDKKSIKRMFLSLVFFALGAGGFIILYAKLLVFGNTLADVGTPNIRAALKYLIFGNISDRGSISVYLTAKYLTMISTTIVVLLSAAGYIHLLLKKKWRAFFALAVWAFPLLVTSAYIYENLHGRAMILGLAPLVIALALFLATLRGWMKIAVLLLVLIQLAVVSFPGVAKYHSQPAPNEDLTKMIANIDQSGVLATSNVTKTWFHYGGKYINFGDVDFGAGLVSDEINKYLQDGEKAYISQDAVYLPTRRYDGLFYDIRSVDIGGASDHKTMLNEIFKAKSIVLSTASERFRQAIYEVQNQPSSDFFRGIASQGNKKDVVFGRILDGDDPISNLNVNIYQRQFCQIEPENITRFDFGFCLWRSLSGRIRAINWMPTDKNGQFAIAENLFNDYQLILAPVSINTWSKNIDDEFYREESTEASPTGEKIFANIGELADFAEGYDGSYYAVKLKGCKQVKMYFINPEFYRTNRLEAEEMASKVGKIVKDRKASNGRVVAGNTPGYLLSGPYINLGRGEYRLEFAVDLQRGTKLRLDVVSAKGGEECAAKNVSGEGKQQFKLRFKLDEPKEDIEFRIEIKSGQAAADYLLLEKV